MVRMVNTEKNSEESRNERRREWVLGERNKLQEQRQKRKRKACRSFDHGKGERVSWDGIIVFCDADVH